MGRPDLSHRIVAGSIFLLLGSLAHAGDKAGQPVEPIKTAPATSYDNAGIQSEPWLMSPLPTTVSPELAAAYCRGIEVNARSYARWSSEAGWAFGIIAAGAIATGPIIIATEGNTPTRTEKVLSLSIPAGGAILGYIASGLFSRGKDHGALAAQAALSMNQATAAAQVTSCNSALAAWNTARSESSSSIASAINNQQAKDKTVPKE